MEARADAHTVRRISVRAYADPRTVIRYLSGRPLRDTSRARIEDALRQLGLYELLRRPAEAA